MYALATCYTLATSRLKNIIITLKFELELTICAINAYVRYKLLLKLKRMLL